GPFLRDRRTLSARGPAICPTRQGLRSVASARSTVRRTDRPRPRRELPRFFSTAGLFHARRAHNQRLAAAHLRRAGDVWKRNRLRSALARARARTTILWAAIARPRRNGNAARFDRRDGKMLCK